MPLNKSRIREFIRKFDFKPLFIELGWDSLPASRNFSIQVNNTNFLFQTLTQKGGFQVFLHDAETVNEIPDRQIGLKLENKLTPLAAEHLVIFTDKQRSKQIWQWSKREAGSPFRISRDEYRKGGVGERLAQKLSNFAFSLEDEESGISITDVTRRNDAQFRERVTRRFYDEFKKQHEAFSRRIEGIDESQNRDWYASLILNRLMFVYFIQQKGFLNSDETYLRTKLKETQAKIGDDMFYSFYKIFLVKFFHKGLGEANHSPELIKIIGKIPYLNGGLFEPHKIEIGNDINIQDKAFEAIFDFFDRYDWHLDDRPLRNDNEINPDVLGYIFEKFINQKQMGAYYTKEDITDYIAKNTIIPFLFDRVRQNVTIAFDRYDGIWKILRENPDRYIYDSVKNGVITDDGEITDIPRDISLGVDDAGARDDWNRPADEYFGLPKETFREYMARRQRCLEIRERMQNGEITAINDLITYNLDVTKFAEDVIFTTESSDFVKAFYHALAGRLPDDENEKFEQGIAVLDPTCGSGAFLFAALKILETLLDKCLDRMEDFVEDEDRLHSNSAKYSAFRRVLGEIEKHPNRNYFVLKSIIVNNLFGVDIMPDAVEICKLRLFLQLVAQVDADPHKKNYGLEPLPDIDFNIRAGNTLVGFANEKEVYQAFQGTMQARLAFDDRADDFKGKAEQTARAYEDFRLRQIRDGGEISAGDKADLQAKLRELSDELDKFIAHEYGIDEIKYPQKFTHFLKSHQPFHWYSEFFGTIAGGGFDVIIGNPPYVEYGEIKNTYKIRNYLTESCGNLYAYTWERCINISQPFGRVGMIVPVASVCTDGYSPLQALLKTNGTIVVSNFNDRPSKLFDGLEHIRLSIILLEKGSQNKKAFSTTYNKWQSEERGNLFQLLSFQENTNLNTTGAIAKLGFPIESSILKKMNADKKGIGEIALRESENKIYYTRKLSHFVQILNFIPQIKDLHGKTRLPSELKEINFPDLVSRNAFLAFLNSSLFYWLITVFSDCRNLNKREIYLPRFDLGSADQELLAKLSKLSTQLMKDINRTSEIRPMGQLKIQCTFPKYSKSIIDEIDRVLAEHYGFTDEELDFIINYDIKYRIGLGE